MSVSFHKPIHVVCGRGAYLYDARRLVEQLDAVLGEVSVREMVEG